MGARQVGTRRSTSSRAALRRHDRRARAGSVALYVSGQFLTEDYYVANKLMKGFIGTRQYRHQFAAVHGLLGRRPCPRLRRGCRPRRLRGYRGGRPGRARRQQRRLVPSGAVPAPRRGAQRARHEDRRDRPAPHRDLRGRRPASRVRARFAMSRCSTALLAHLAESGASIALIGARTTGFDAALEAARDDGAVARRGRRAIADVDRRRSRHASTTGSPRTERTRHASIRRA